MSRTVLLIEDEHALRDIMLWALKDKDYDVLVAEDGEEGLKLSGRADLIMLNLSLPKKTGEEVLKEIRAKGNYVPVIIMTAAMGRAEGLKKFGKYEIVDFVEKPFSTKKVLEKIEESMGVVKSMERVREASSRLGSFIARQTMA